MRILVVEDDRKTADYVVKGLSEALDIEFSRFGVGVRCIMPWFVETQA